MYYLLLVSVGFFVCAVFLRPRTFDFLTIYAIFLLLYNIPTIFGVVVDPFTGDYQSASDELVFATAIIFISSIPFYFVKSGPSPGLYEAGDVNDSLVGLVLFFLLAIFLVVFAVSLPQLLSSSSKRDLVESGNNLYSFFGMLPVLGFFISFKSRRKVYALIFISLALLMMSFGSRRPFAILFIGVFLFYFAGQKISPKRYLGMLSLGGVGLIILTLGKSFYSFVMMHGFEGVYLWLVNFRMEYFFAGSEFMGRSSILSAIIANDFSVDTLHILKSILAIQPIPMSYFGYSSSAFNEQFQSALFSGLDYGMAYNPWAEAYAWLGYVGIAIYSSALCISLIVLWRAYCNSSLIWSSLVMMVAILLAFWIHRNSLGSELAYVRNALYPSVFVYILSFIVHRCLRRGLR